MVGAQGRIIVHAPLDIFDDVLPENRGRRVGVPQSLTRSPRVTPDGKNEPGSVTRKKNVGYVNRHIQRGVAQKPSPRRAQQRTQLQVGSATPYFVPAPGETQSGLGPLQEESMAASGENMHQDYPPHDDGSDPFQTPPQWRRISAIDSGPPHLGFLSSSARGQQEYDRLREDSNRHDDHGRRPKGTQGKNYQPNRYPNSVGGDDLGNCSRRQARRDPESTGECDENSDHIGQDRRFNVLSNSGRQGYPFPSEEPELDQYGPQAHGPLRYGSDRNSLSEGAYADHTYLESRGGRGSDSFRRCLDDQERSSRGDGDMERGFDRSAREEFSGDSTNNRSAQRGLYYSHGGEAPPFENDRGYAQHDGGNDESGLAAGAPSAHGTGSSSDHRSSGRHGMSHASGGEERSVEEIGRDGEEMATGRRRQTGQDIRTIPTQSFGSSARWQPMTAEPLPPPGATVSPKVPQREKIGPNRRRRSQTEGPESPTSTSRWPRSPVYDDEKQTPRSLNEALVKSPKDMLLFSKKARQVDFKPKTLKQYRETKPTQYVQLGKLQPDLFTEELVAKRANAERTKEFSANLRKINCDAVATRRAETENRRSKKPEAQDSRSKALAFARKIPLPKKKPTQQHPEAEPPSAKQDKADPRERRRGDRREGEDPPGEEAGWKSRELTELEALEALHENVTRKAQRTRSNF